MKREHPKAALSVIGGEVTLKGTIYEGRACVCNVPEFGGCVVVLAMNDEIAMAACEVLSGMSMDFGPVCDALIGSPHYALRTL